MLSNERMLIVEDEFLIALDIQRVLDAANAKQTVVARNFEEVAALGDGLAAFGLAILTSPRPGTGDQAIADTIAAAGLAIVVCSAARNSLAGTKLADAEYVDKPFADADLLAACERAIAKRDRAN